MKNKVTKLYIRQLVKEALQETTFVDPKGRAVDLTGDRESPKDRRYFEKNKIFDHPNQEIRKKADILRSRSKGFGFDEEGYVVPISSEEKEEAQKELDFLIDMSHHPNERIRNMFNSEKMKEVNQALSFADVFPPPKYTPPPMTDDEEYEQGIYDDFDTEGGYGEHNYPRGETSLGQYHEIFDNLMNKAVKRVQDAYDSGERNQSKLASIASKTPGLQQTWDKHDYDSGQTLEDLNFIPYLAVEKVVGKDNIEDLGYAGRLDESKSSKVTKSFIRQLVKEEIRKGKK